MSTLKECWYQEEKYSQFDRTQQFFFTRKINLKPFQWGLRKEADKAFSLRRWSRSIVSFPLLKKRNCCIHNLVRGQKSAARNTLLNKNFLLGLETDFHPLSMELASSHVNNLPTS